jgi:hypothetical protein
MVGKMITALRKEELQAEYAYTILAKDMIETLRADPKLNPQPPDLREFLTTTFKGYSTISDTVVTDDEITCLTSMDDNSLRQALARILLGMDRVEAVREAKKPHTSAEIADMEVMVRHGGDLYHLLMPVKSGLEIKDSSVSVSYFYQILRPHMFFQKGVVVFITAKPCSQFLQNYIKQERDRLGWPIAVIEGRDLAALLKINECL